MDDLAVIGHSRVLYAGVYGWERFRGDELDTDCPSDDRFSVVFFSLLYVEKSLLWNGIVAFLFWMPVVGWWRLIPEMQEVPFYDVFYVVFQIGLVHACIQVLGRIVMNLFTCRETTQIKKAEQE